MRFVLITCKDLKDFIKSHCSRRFPEAWSASSSSISSIELVLLVKIWKRKESAQPGQLWWWWWWWFSSGAAFFDPGELEEDLELVLFGLQVGAKCEKLEACRMSFVAATCCTIHGTWSLWSMSKKKSLALSTILSCCCRCDGRLFFWISMTRRLCCRRLWLSKLLYKIDEIQGKTKSAGRAGASKQHHARLWRLS